MKDETIPKVKSQATSATINFVRELVVVDENDIEDVKKESTVIKQYVPELLGTCS